MTVGAAYLLAAVYAAVLRSGRAPDRRRVRAARHRPAHVDGDRLRLGRRHERRDLALRAHLPLGRDPPRPARAGSSRRSPARAAYALLCGAFALRLVVRRRPTSPSAHTRRAGPTWATRSSSTCSALVRRHAARELPRRAPAHHRRAPRGGHAPRRGGRAPRRCSAASPRGSRTRSETRSGRSPARSRCSAPAARSRTRTRSSARSSSARPRASTTSWATCSISRARARPRKTAVDLAVARARRRARSPPRAAAAATSSSATKARAPRPSLADAAQMRQVLWNLVRNAVQASAPGAEVIVRVARQGRPARSCSR